MTRGTDASVGDLALARAPAVYCPFPPRVSPYAARVQRYAVAWATRHGLLRTPREQASFAHARFASLMARAYPDASLPDLFLAVSWLTFTFMLDDHLEAALGRDPDRQRRVAGDVLAHLAGGPPPAALPRALAGALADIWVRTGARTSAGWRRRFIGHVAGYLAGNAWEADNRRRSRVPPVDEYLRMRRQTAATAMFFDLAEPLAGVEDVAATDVGAGLDLLRAYADDVVAWFNDLVSWQKEAAGGDPHNLVLVLAHERGLPLAEAVREVVTRHDRAVRGFLAAARVITEGRPAADRVVAGLKHWIRANVDWSHESGRYASLDGC